ncbi:MAG: NAD(P)-binding protein, partial [Clostridia bacterium]|nr:NAD(P)-binding protein [Clostridia bacterium]
MAKIIIVGGGAAGLSAGIYAQDLGHEAVIYESHTAAGGNLTGWERGGYGIDNCLHWLTGTNEKTKAYKMWRRLGVLEDAKIYSPDSLYSCEYGGERLCLCRSLDQLRGDMKRISPRDSKRIDSFVSAVRAIQFLQGFEKRGASGVVLLPFYLKTTAGELAASFYSPLIRTFLSSFLSERIGSLALLFV